MSEQKIAVAPADEATSLRAHERFVSRHIGTAAQDRAKMAAALGYDTTDDVVTAALPASIRSTSRTATGALPPPATEQETLAHLRRIASRNAVRTSMIGLGYYGTFTPAVIKRNVLESPAWYTAYTPYQPEISQGRLEALLNFQTMVADLTGLDTANASMLDEATAVVEGMLLARRATGDRPARFVVDSDALPQTKAVLRTRAEALGIELVERELDREGSLPEAFGVFIQYPGASGRVWDFSHIVEAAHEQGALVVVAADLLALTVLTPPGEMHADIAVGTTQRFGVPMAFGGPHAGYLAVRSGLERQLPGRLVGVSKDADDRPAYRLTLQTREQHIRREKATSNICTAQVLLAIMASMYAVYHGPAGLRAIASAVAARAGRLADALAKLDFPLVHEEFFDTLSVRVADGADAVIRRAYQSGILLHRVDAHTISISVDETTTAEQLELVVEAFAGSAAEASGRPPVAAGGSARLPAGLLRSSRYLEHPVFNSHHSETSMMRYLKQLADKDYALDRGMIPLGSCTMKLNAATEMEAVSWPEFANIHPFAPKADVAGYLELIGDLEDWLAALTGYDAVSLQPNAGSQGELAGLLAIRGYHRSRGDLDRNVCLIPQSAHGTNAASAVLAGMTVAIVACDEQGNVDLADLRAKVAQHADRLAALMVTYPSTHGVYEQDIRAICDEVHAAGGQVYIDGANLNALLGHARFGEFGGDVSHLNLHKTFCIPHGGGGPGVGPVAAKAHLAPFLPGHPFAQRDAERDKNPVSAAAYGSPGILPITWAYIRMMGEEGLREATGAAVLAANYIAARLKDEYPLLYSGAGGLVAHECILDLRPLTAATGVTVDDVAKRLIDFGFHAPTMSFPVAGTLMVEPTESEDLAEIERFIDAMTRIRHEADKVASGQWPADDNPLKGAPHTAESVIAGEWSHAYTREDAVYPVSSLIRNKYWPPVRRVDQAWGDRNLVCSCPPADAFA